MITVLKLILKGIYDLRLNKWEHLLTLCAIILVSFLGLLFLLFLHNIQNQIVENNNQVKFTVYWEKGVNKDLIEKQWEELRKKPGTISVETYTSNQAATILAESLGKDVDFEIETSKNKLPPTAVLTYEFSPDNLKKRANQEHQIVRDLKYVEEVNYDEKAINKSSAWLNDLKKIIWPLITLLILLIGIIVGNTFKISQISKKEEIEVLKLIGAGNWYIRLPLFAGAAMQSIVGGTIALGFLKTTQAILNNILNTPPLWLKLEFLNQTEIISVLACLIGISLISSWVAIRY